MTEPLKVGWIISGNEQVASCRLQGFLVHEQLLKLGVDSRIVATDFHATHPGYSVEFFRLARRLRRPGAFDVLTFERPNWMAFKLSQLCRLAGIRTVGIRCDLLPGPYDESFDLTIVPTDDLAVALGVRRYRAIEDMIEVPEDWYKVDYRQAAGRLSLVWVGHPSYRDFIVGFGQALLECKALRERVELRTISRGSWATHQWSLDTVHELLLAADVAVLPIPEGEQFAIKSANRLTMCMALGLPTIATPIRSYEGVGLRGQAWLAAGTLQEFADQIVSLFDEPRRRELGVAARRQARSRYSAEHIGSRWMAAIRDIVVAPPVDPRRQSVRTRLVDAALTLTDIGTSRQSGNRR